MGLVDHSASFQYCSLYEFRFEKIQTGLKRGNETCRGISVRMHTALGFDIGGQYMVGALPRQRVQEMVGISELSTGTGR